MAISGAWARTKMDVACTRSFWKILTRIWSRRANRCPSDSADHLYGISHINCTWLHVSCTYRIIFNFSTRISETNVCWKSKIFRKSIIFSDLLKVLETRILSLDLEYLIYCGAPTRTNLKLVRSKISFHIRMIFISNISISPLKIILWFSRLDL